MRTLFFQSLGCPKNLVDSEVMLGITQKEGYQIEQDPTKAQVIVLNTCSFIEASKRESIETILRLAENKVSGKCERLVVAGCLPQRYLSELEESLPEVDAFLGTGQYHRILEFIEDKKTDSTDFKYPKFLHGEATPRINSQVSHRAYLKISEGCIKNCSFCIIPKIRGTLRSRTIPSLLKEAKALVDSGVQELNLIGQDLTDYGRDLRNETNLVGLLKELAKLEGLKWIRLFYVYPDELSDELLELIASEPKICKYLDMPIQHISDRMLKLMNRRTTGEQIRNRISRLRERVPGIVLRTTVLVGFPGETEEEFQELLEFVKESKFENLGAFAYSREDNTSSYFLKDQIDEDVKQDRRDRIMKAQQDLLQPIWNSYLHKQMPVLVEKVDAKKIQGRFYGQAPEIDGIVHVKSSGTRPTIGSWIDVTIQKINHYDLVGTIT